jgi:hypothetical protein
MHLDAPRWRSVLKQDSRHDQQTILFAHRSDGKTLPPHKERRP